MNVPIHLKIVVRFASSIALSIFIFMATMAFVPTIAIYMWLLPGKAIAPLAALALPHAWVFGNPSADNYWYQAEVGGFVFMCGQLFWAIIIFSLWQWRSIRKHKTQAQY
jgi:hypothetical protein